MNKTDCNTRVVLTVIWFVGSGFIVGLFGLLVLAAHGINIPESIPPIVGGLAGVLGTLLTTTRGNRPEEPVPVQTVPGEPLETKEVGEPSE